MATTKLHIAKQTKPFYKRTNDTQLRKIAIKIQQKKREKTTKQNTNNHKVSRTLRLKKGRGFLKI